MSENLPAKIYCHQRSQLYAGVFYFAFFFAMALYCVIGAYRNIDNSISNPKLFALLSGSFWFCWVFLSIWIILVYYCERLVISKETITKYYIVRKKVIAVDEILCIKWPSVGQLRGLHLESPIVNINIYLSEYTNPEQDEIIQFLHTTVPIDLQENWSEFQETYYRFQDKEPPAPPTAKDLILTTVILLAISGLFIYYWWIEIGVKNLVFGAMTSLIALWYLSRLRHLQVNAQDEHRE